MPKSKQSSDIIWKTLIRSKHLIDERKCPFDESHYISAGMFDQHVRRCCFSNYRLNKRICPYNPCHVVDCTNFESHKINCIDRHNYLKKLWKPITDDKSIYPIRYRSDMVRDAPIPDNSINNKQGYDGTSTKSVFNELENLYNSATKTSNKSFDNQRSHHPIKNLKINSHEYELVGMKNTLINNHLISKTIPKPVKTRTTYMGMSPTNVGEEGLKKKPRKTSTNAFDFGSMSSTIIGKGSLKKNQPKTSTNALDFGGMSPRVIGKESLKKKQPKNSTNAFDFESMSSTVIDKESLKKKLPQTSTNASDFGGMSPRIIGIEGLEKKPPKNSIKALDFGGMSPRIIDKEGLKKKEQKTSTNALDCHIVLRSPIGRKQICSKYMEQYSSTPIAQESAVRSPDESFERYYSESERLKKRCRDMTDMHNRKIFVESDYDLKLKPIKSSLKRRSTESQNALGIFSNIMSRTLESFFGNITYFFPKRSKTFEN